MATEMSANHYTNTNPKESFDQQNSTTIIQIDQPLDGMIARRIDVLLSEVINSDVSQIIVDMKNMPYLTTTGSSLLVNLCINIKNNQQVYFINSNDSVRHLLQIIGLTDYIKK